MLVTPLCCTDHPILLDSLSKKNTMSSIGLTIEAQSLQPTTKATNDSEGMLLLSLRVVDDEVLGILRNSDEGRKRG